MTESRDAAGTTREESADEESASLELEETWTEARREAGLDPDAIGMVEPDRVGPGLVSPYLVLYAGFFLGPPLALASALMVAPREINLRRFTVMLGIAGAAWCAVQGATGALAPTWSHTALQMLRSGVNFAGSAVLVLFWYRQAPSSFLHDRRTIATSFGMGTLFLVAFVMLPPDVLAYIGR